jgi:rod shape-determining protein MreD
MTDTHSPKLIVTIFSLLMALMLDVLPLPTWATWIRPEWTALVVLYWVLNTPWRINVGIAWLMGLILDGLNGTLLGEHAVAMVVIAYLMSHWGRRFRLFPVWQQALGVGALLAIYLLIIYVIQGISGQPLQNIAFVLSIIPSMLLWPWIQALLTDKHDNATNPSRA